MRRQDIQLLAQARRGDVRARCEIGRRYLTGSDGFIRHAPTGIEYLSHPSVAALPEAACILAELLPLHELIELGQQAALGVAVAAGSRVAMVRAAVWSLLQREGRAEALRLLGEAAAGGQELARRASELLAETALPPEEQAIAVLRLLHEGQLIDGPALTRLAASRALADSDLEQAVPCLRAALVWPLAVDDERSGELARHIVAAVRLAETAGGVLRGLPGEAVRLALEQSAMQGDREAAYALARGLCGVGCPALPDEVFAEHQNMRKGAAFLLRAADAGCDAAWLHLYRLHADHRLSVANPPMARFFLEKAAHAGQALAQRLLGALLLREAATLGDSEQAIAWLHLAMQQGDALATALLRTLVLPVAGSQDEAARGLELVRASEPWLAARMELARAYGLTRLEALTVQPTEGQRPWGLVVGRNPFITQARLAAPRAVPALDAPAQDALQRAAQQFGQLRGAGGHGHGPEGALRKRSQLQRTVFARLRLDESLYFADASSGELETLRLGPKWAWRERRLLNEALDSGA